MFFHKCHDVLLLSNISWGKIYAPAAASSSRLHLFKYQCNNRTNNRKINPPTPRTDCTASGSQTLHNASPQQSDFFFFFFTKGPVFKSARWLQKCRHPWHITSSNTFTVFAAWSPLHMVSFTMHCRHTFVFLLRAVLYHSYNEGILPKGGPLFAHCLKVCCINKHIHVMSRPLWRQPGRPVANWRRLIPCGPGNRTLPIIFLFLSRNMVFSDPIKVIIDLQVLRELSVRARCWAAVWQLTLACNMIILSKTLAADTTPDPHWFDEC